MNLKFCLDPEYLDSALALGLIQDAEDYEHLADTVLRHCLYEKRKSLGIQST